MKTPLQELYEQLKNTRELINDEVEQNQMLSDNIKFKSGDDFIAFHGSYNKIKDFKFPLFVSTSQLRAQIFAINMKWDDKRQKNVFKGAKVGDVGYVYKLKIKNANIKKIFKDEILLTNANIEIIDSYMVEAVKNPLNPRSIIPKIK